MKFSLVFGSSMRALYKLDEIREELDKHGYYTRLAENVSELRIRALGSEETLILKYEGGLWRLKSKYSSGDDLHFSPELKHSEFLEEISRAMYADFGGSSR